MTLAEHYVQFWGGFFPSFLIVILKISNEGERGFCDEQKGDWDGDWSQNVSMVEIKLRGYELRRD